MYFWICFINPLAPQRSSKSHNFSHLLTLRLRPRFIGPKRENLCRKSIWYPLGHGGYRRLRAKGLKCLCNHSPAIEISGNTKICEMIKPYKLVERYLEEIKAAIQQDDYDLSQSFTCHWNKWKYKDMRDDQTIQIGWTVSRGDKSRHPTRWLWSLARERNCFLTPGRRVLIHWNEVIL